MGGEHQEFLELGGEFGGDGGFEGGFFGGDCSGSWGEADAELGTGG